MQGGTCAECITGTFAVLMKNCRSSGVNHNCEQTSSAAAATVADAISGSSTPCQLGDLKILAATHWILEDHL
eukprot:2190822-Amphidinium_carterae.1